MGPAGQNGPALRHVQRRALSGWAPRPTDWQKGKEAMDREVIGWFLAGLNKGTKWRRPVTKVTAVELAVKGVLSSEQLATFVMTKKGFIPSVRAELAMLAVQGLLPDAHLAQYIKGDPGFIKAMGRAVQKCLLDAVTKGDYEEAQKYAKLMPE